MTTHPGEGTLQALLDDEVRPAERGELERHVAGCAHCAAELQAMREDTKVLVGALALLDEPVNVEQARWRLEGRTRRRGTPVRGAGLTGAALRRSAILMVGSAAVLSATVPGSPVREWLTDSWDRYTTTAEPIAPEPAPTVALPDVAPEPTPSGVSVRPEGPMRVVLRDLAPGVRLRVQLHDGERVGVWASGEAAQARFRTAPERIEVEAVSAGEVRVEIPRLGQRLTLEVNGRVYLRKDGEQLRFPGPPAEAVGPEIVFEVRP
jgi:hypothetical protein